MARGGADNRDKADAALADPLMAEVCLLGVPTRPCWLKMFPAEVVELGFGLVLGATHLGRRLFSTT